MKFTTVAAFSACVALASAGPAVDKFRQGVDWSQRSTSSTIQITGTVSETITGTETGYVAITKVSGSINGTVNLQDLYPTFAINTPVFFTGTEQSSERVRWAITCPGAVGQTVNVNGVNIVLTSVTGTYTAVFSSISPVRDPVSGLPRNVSHTKSGPDTNTLVIRGNVNGLPFLPVTATQTAVEYDGFSGGAGLGLIQGVATLQGAANSAGLAISVRANDQTFTATTATDGSWWVITPFAGTHNVRTKLPTGLTRLSANVALSTGTPSLALTYLNGDCDNNDIVDIGDYSVLAAAFDATPTDANWNVAADLNRDQIVDIADYSLLAGNFDVVGE
ncbi:MAG: hypothetical protein JNJ45_06245 [Chthonomonas sp.]|nr:hypothetical protein [Chthonomonas sp.]